MAATAEFSEDPKGHYEALRLQPGAVPEEIERAYLSLLEEWRQCRSFSRFAVQEAYRFLSDPECKAVYDASARPGPPEPSLGRRSLALSAILLMLFLQAGFVFPGFLRAPPPPFHSGEVLARVYDQVTLGRVSRLEIYHRFPRGIVARAYLIRVPGGQERWYPARDLERHFQLASQGVQ